MKIPGFSRLNVLRDAGNMCADEDAVFLAVGEECWRLDGDSGERRSYPVLGSSGHTWGYVGRAGDVLIGSAVRPDNAYKGFWGAKYWYDGQSGFGTDQVCSDQLFALDPTTGATLWSYSGSLVLDVTITTAEGKIWFLESRNPGEIAKDSRRLKMADLKNSMFLTCLDIDSGAKEFERALNFDGGTPSVYLSYDSGKLVLATSRESNDRFYTCVLDATDGSRIWTRDHSWRSSHHGGNHQHPVVMGGKVYLEPNVFDLNSGAILASNMPGRSGCSTFIGTGEALVYRGVATIQYGGNVSMWPIGGGSPSFWDRTRPSCWISAIAADGMVIVQDGGSGCSCGSWLETSIGFAPKK
jgi:outer membrane protein assembly factor BamB